MPDCVVLWKLIGRSVRQGRRLKGRAGALGHFCAQTPCSSLLKLNACLHLQFYFCILLCSRGAGQGAQAAISGGLPYQRAGQAGVHHFYDLSTAFILYVLELVRLCMVCVVYS